MKKKIFPYALAVLCGGLLTLAFPRADLDVLAWFALTPLLWVVREGGLRRAFGYGFLAGLVHAVTLVYWVESVMNTYGGLPMTLSVPVMFLLAAYLALYTGAFAALTRFCAPSPGLLIPAAASLWVGLEFVRTLVFTGFPWCLLGVTQHARLPVLQMADLFGVYGISALIVAVNASVFLGLLFFSQKTWNGKIPGRASALGSLAFALCAFLAAFIYGEVRLDQYKARTDAPAITVTAIQGNVDQAVKWDPTFQWKTVEGYLALVRQGVTPETGLVVFPETALPFYFLRERALSEAVLQGIRETGKPFLVSSPAVEFDLGRRRYFNSAFLVSPDGRVQSRYDKVHLVPWGEYVPLKDWIPFIGKLTQEVGDYSSGTPGRTLSLGDARLGVLICYEAIFPALARKQTEHGANLLVNITNDAWFGRSSAPYQHFAMAVVRAVENRRALVRAANTGISGFILPTGGVVEATSLYTPAAVTATLPLEDAIPPYVRWSDTFAALMGVLALLLMVWGFKTRLDP